MTTWVGKDELFEDRIIPYIIYLYNEQLVDDRTSANNDVTPVDRVRFLTAISAQ